MVNTQNTITTSSPNVHHFLGIKLVLPWMSRYHGPICDGAKVALAQGQAMKIYAGHVSQGNAQRTPNIADS
ncbi:hypothetical protein TEQG_08782 [Trichophyton equinum CBS 127.97]|uniref:Uncharacterized protein n=1 Tax=Trichophyton equinum (strain ATCC MYA-4606 / CBS 127.97) TaxID=559882 RepID=F2Q211_TRIEC|nr:hypothetical protein TEQG_08782 [Trichophyton equinum CBS 127.97]